jgi:hypothetical protein
LLMGGCEGAGSRRRPCGEGGIESASTSR